LVRLPQIIDLCSTVGPNLKRLALDFSPVHATPSQVEMIRPHVLENNIFANMPALEELIVSYHFSSYFWFPPLNLKRLGITAHDHGDAEWEFCFSIASLETLVFLHLVRLSAVDIDAMFDAYKGKSLDIVLVDINSHQQTPRETRSWKEEVTVRIWEADMPAIYYGDEDDLILSDNWIWMHGVEGTLWSQEKRRMASWEEIERRLAGLVHTIVGGVPA
jgi:hypothetical protein